MISKYTVKHPVAIVIVFILLLSLGIYAALDLSIDLYPEINPPVLLVMANYGETGPEEVEKLITRPLESALSNVGNIDEISSTSSRGYSQVIIRFTWGTDMSEAANDVRDKLEFVRNYLPEDAETPMIFKFDPAMMPILFLAVTGVRTPEELLKISEDIIQPRLEQVEGVAMAGVSGGRERMIRVEISQNRLEAYNLTLTQISNMLRGQNIQISAGSITEANKNYLVRTAGEYTDIEQIKNTVIGYKGLSGVNPMTAVNMNSTIPIRLRDIADVYDGLKDEENTVLIDGNPGVYIKIQKQSGTNSVKTADNVLARLEKIKKELPNGIKIEVVNDTTKIIRTSLNTVVNSVVSGALLAVLILFLFLRSIKSVFIIGISIPLSVVITLMLMYFFNLTLNLMTLTGLALGVGMLVDNSIVILENIYRYREKGAKASIAAILGSQEMMTAISASTLTTICVFAPIVMFKDQLGMIGELFSGLAFTVVISLVSSLLVAIFLVPVLTSKYFQISSRMEEPLTGILKILDDFLEKFWTGLSNGYKNALKFVLKHKAVTIIIMVAIFISAMFLIPVAGFEFMPQSGEDSVSVEVELPIGTTLEETKDIMNQIELTVKSEVKSYKKIVTSTGEKGFMGIMGASQSNKGKIMITLPPYAERVEDSFTIKEKLRKHFNDFPSAIFTFSRSGMGLRNSPIDIIVKTNDLDKARYVAEKIKELLKNNVPEVTEPVIDMKDGLPQIEISIDRDKAYSLGLNMASIGTELRANIAGVTASTFREGGSEYDILVILEKEDKDALPDLEKIFVVSSMGKRIPFSSFAQFVKTTGPVSIRRENQTRVVHVTGGIKPGVKLNEVELRVRKLINQEIPQDDETVIEFSGDFAEMMKYFQKFFFILIISIALVFGIMAAQFESFLDPFIIFFTIPLCLIGVILIYLATGQKFSIFTAVGLIVLVGIVVNNGIILVDYANMLIERNMSIFDAMVEAGGNRLRPILMTTLTTVLGLGPMAFVKGEGSDLSQPLALTVLGGLTVSTLMTLFLIPSIYSIFYQMRAKREAKKAVKKEKRMQYRKKKLSEAKL